MPSITSSVESIFSGVANVFSGILESILAIVNHALHLIMGIVHTAWSAVEGIVNAALHVVTGLLSTVTHVFGDVVGIVTGELKEWGDYVVDGGKSVGSGVLVDANTISGDGLFAVTHDYIHTFWKELIDSLNQLSPSHFTSSTSPANIIPIALIGVGVILATTFAGKKSGSSPTSSVKKATKSGGRRKKA